MGWNAKVLWFNKAKEYGEALADNGIRVFLFQGAFNNYVPEAGDTILIHKMKRVKERHGFLKPMDLYAYEASFISR